MGLEHYRRLTWSSDHFPILISYLNNTSVSACINYPPRLKFQEANFDRYKEILSTKINEINILERKFLNFPQ